MLQNMTREEASAKIGSMDVPSNKTPLPPQDIIDALGGVPVPLMRKKKSSSPLYLGIGVIFLSLVLVVAVVGLSNTSPSSPATVESNIIKPEDRTEAYRDIAVSSTIIIGFTSSMNEKDFVTSATMFHEDSVIKLQGISEDVIQDYVGTNVDWSSCEVVEQDAYRAATLKVTDSKTYQIQYIPVSCSTFSGTTRLLEFDMRHVDSEQPRIFDIIARVL